jgi:hypothetical protein
MTQRNLLTLFICACASLLCGFGQTPAHGQSLGISPATFEANVKRGATYNKVYTIANNTGTRLRLHLSVGDYWYGEHNERVEGRPGTLPRSASLWVQFTPNEVIIEPHGSASVNAIITVPQEAAGGYYTVPIIEAEAADKLAGAVPQNGQVTTTLSLTATVTLRFNGLMMLTTEDAAEYNVEIMGGSITPPTASASLEMQLDVRNRSTAHAHVRGVFAILNAAGRLAGRGKLEDKRYLPGQRDTLRVHWGGELAPGHYTAIVTLTYDRAGAEPATLVYDMPFDVK